MYTIYYISVFYDKIQFIMYMSNKKIILLVIVYFNYNIYN